MMKNTARFPLVRQMIVENALRELVKEEWEGRSGLERKSSRDSDASGYREYDELLGDNGETIKHGLGMRDTDHVIDFYRASRLGGDDFESMGRIENIPRKLRIMNVLRTTNAKSVRQALNAFMKFASRIEAVDPSGENVRLGDIFDNYDYYDAAKIDGITLVQDDRDLGEFSPRRIRAILNVAKSHYADPLDKVEAFMQTVDDFEGAGLPNEDENGVPRAEVPEVERYAKLVNNKIHEIPFEGSKFTWPVKGKRFESRKDRFGRRIRNFPS